MTHINPTLIAHTQPSGAACSDRAGSAHNLGYLELREAQLAVINHNPDLELPEFTVLQRVQLSDIARKALDEEFDLLRIVLAALKKAVLGEEDEETLKILARLLDVLGITASRTASVIRVESSLKAGGVDDGRIGEILAQLQGALLQDEPHNEGEQWK